MDSVNVREIFEPTRVNLNQKTNENQVGNNKNVITQFEGNNRTKKELKESLDQLNQAVKVNIKELKFELHDKTGRMMVKVIDIKKHRVIKELPPEEMLDMLGKIKEMVGVIIDEKI